MHHVLVCRVALWVAFKSLESKQLVLYQNCESILNLWSFCLPGSGWSSESHAGVSAGHRDPPGREGNHRAGRGASAGGGQPAVWLGLAGDAQPRHPEGERHNTTQKTISHEAIQSFSCRPLFFCALCYAVHFLWIALIGCSRWWRRSNAGHAVKSSTEKQQPNTTPPSATWDNWRKNSNAPSTSPGQKT